MRSLIICASVSHGNTRRVADRMAEVLECEVIQPDAVDVSQITQYDLVGFGSGVYFMAVHPRLWDLVGRLPQVDGIPAFTFFTSGGSELPVLGYSRLIRWRIASKGFRMLDSFACRGFDTAGPLRFLGGVNKGHPDDHDLEAAAGFAAGIREQVKHSRADS